MKRPFFDIAFTLREVIPKSNMN